MNSPIKKSSQEIAKDMEIKEKSLLVETLSQGLTFFRKQCEDQKSTIADLSKELMAFKVRALRGVIFKIQPLRNPSIFKNMICVLISKVLLMGMSNHPHFEIFWTSSKI